MKHGIDDRLLRFSCGLRFFIHRPPRWCKTLPGQLATTRLFCRLAASGRTNLFAQYIARCLERVVEWQFLKRRQVHSRQCILLSHVIRRRTS